MSAIEWLNDVQPYIVTLLVISILVAIPQFNKPNNQHLFKFKKTFFILWVIILCAWAVASLALHITTPIMRVNLRDVSKVILVPSLIAIAVIDIIRLLQRNTLLWQLLSLVKTIVLSLTPFLSASSFFVAKAALEGIADTKNETPSDEDKKFPANTNEIQKNIIQNLALNYHSEYCDKSGINWY